MFLNDESLLVGASTSILIKPKLTINGRAADLSLLQNTRIVLQTTNYIDNVPVTRNYDGIVFDSKREYLLQFQVPPNLGKISVSLTTEVKNTTTKRMDTFS